MAALLLIRMALLIDTDTASDDAVALIMALRSPEVDVLGITTVAGNVEVTQATRNALYVVALCGAETPVYEGAQAGRAHHHLRGARRDEVVGEHPGRGPGPDPGRLT